MLGYRHAFHAGNHADILKHIVLCDCLQYLTRKEKALLYCDTHAGAGSYRILEGYAAQNREWESGLGRLLSRTNISDEPPASVSRYLEILSDYQREDPDAYPGSPVLAARLLRPQDRLFFCELHPADFEELSARFSQDPRVRVRKEDGFFALKSVLPPPSRRGLVFIDPSYEIPSDYDRALAAVNDAVRRFATGTILIWHPILSRPDALSFPDRLLDLSDRPRLSFSLQVRSVAPGERGMIGSGMTILNPPWHLERSLQEVLPFLSRIFSQDEKSEWSLRSFPVSV